MPVAQAQPLMMPVLGEMLLFALRGFRAGRELEETFEQTMEQLKQQAAQPKPPAPDPNMVKAEAEVRQIDKKTELEEVKAVKEMQHDDVKLGLDVQKAQREAMQPEIPE